MKNNIILSDKYADQREMVEQVILRFEDEGESVHAGRNSVKVFTAPNGGGWNVKRYHVPNLLNRVVYTWFRQPKGIRAFNNAQRILQAGLETPYPIAYVEERKDGMIHFSYLFCEQCPYTHRFYEFGDAKVGECEDVLLAFARFTAQLHKNGIFHRDYSPGNILFDEINGEWHFSLVDINRMSFYDGEVTLEDGCANFARLWGQPEWFRFLARAYAKDRNADPDECEHLVMAARLKFWKPRARHNTLDYTIRF